MRMFLRTGIVAALALIVSACAPNEQLPTSTAGLALTDLTGSSWRLVEIQSMDDAQGTTKPGDPDKYRMQFETGGRAVFELDCNRGTGSWTMVAAGDNSGAISFGPIATTRMACPPPSLGDRLANDLASVRGYRLVDGRLSLSLIADGGILVWERADELR